MPTQYSPLPRSPPALHYLHLHSAHSHTVLACDDDMQAPTMAIGEAVACAIDITTEDTPTQGDDAGGCPHYSYSYNAFSSSTSERVCKLCGCLLGAHTTATAHPTGPLATLWQIKAAARDSSDSGSDTYATLDPAFHAGSLVSLLRACSFTHKA